VAKVWFKNKAQVDLCLTAIGFQNILIAF